MQAIIGNKISILHIVFLLSIICCAVYADEAKNNLQQKHNQFSEDEILQEIDKSKAELNREDIPIEEKTKILLQISNLYNSIWKCSESVQILEEFIKNYRGIKEEPHLLLILGMEYVMIGEIEQASNCFDEIIRDYPDNKITEHAKKELELLKNNNFNNLMSEGRAELSYVKNLSSFNGWYFVIKSITKFNIYRFILVGFFILAVRGLQRNKNTQLASNSINKFFTSKQNYWMIVLLTAAIFIFIQPLFRILFLAVKYGVNEHFTAYNYYAKHLIAGSKDIYVIDFLSSAIGISLIVYILKKQNVSLRQLFFRNIAYSRYVFLLISVTIVAYFLLTYLWVVIAKLFHYDTSLRQILFSISDKKYFFAFINAVIFIPIFQELFFRGVFLQVLLEKTGAFYAITLSSLMFALYNLNYDFSQLSFFFVYGLILALIYKKMGICSCVLLHAILVLRSYV